MKNYIAYIAAITALGLSPAWADAIEGKASPADIIAATSDEDWRALDPENTLYFELERGRVVIALSTSLAHNHVSQIKSLAREGFYEGLSFYRVIDGFVAQGGDPFSERDVKTAKTEMVAEFDEPLTDETPFVQQVDIDGYAPSIGWVDSLPVGADLAAKRIWHLHCTGAFAYGRNNETDSASTEIYIALQPQRYLDRNLTVAGRVVYGMEHIQALRRVSPPETKEDDLGETIKAVHVAADVSEEKRIDLEILDSNSASFADYIEARRNRPEAFFYFRPDYMDICALNVPVRPIESE